MFEKALAEKFKKVFGLQKVTFDRPGESNEQEVVFIEIEDPRITIAEGIQRARVSGRASVFVRGAKMPFGYFQKCIAAHPDECIDIAFFNIDTNVKTYMDVVQRTFEFIYFFSSQYDPEIGTLNEVTIEVNT